MEARVQAFLRSLAARGRLLVLGGHAVIQHGLNRDTIDTDVWLEPMSGATLWSEAVKDAAADFPATYLWDLARRERITFQALPDAICEWGVIRVGGLYQPVDIFRRPNNFTEQDFDAAWTEGRRLEKEDNIRVLHEVDLIATKETTERQTDRQDIAFLEGKIRSELAPVLAACTIEEARRIFARYADHETCRAALQNPKAEVRALAVETLREFAEMGNPFAKELLSTLR